MDESLDVNCYLIDFLLLSFLLLLTPMTVAGVKRLAASVCDSVCLSVCPHDKTKTAETVITKLGTG